MKAKYMDGCLREYIDNKSRIEGRIAELSSHGFMVITENELVYFLTEKRYIAPMSLVLEDPEFKNKVSVNQEVVFTKDRILIGFEEMEISTEGAEVLELNGIDIDKYISPETLREREIIIERCIYSNGKHEGFAPLIFNVGEYVPSLENFNKFVVYNNLYTTVAFQSVIEFMEKLVSGDIEDIWNYSTNIIGFGPGVTPSSNDFICGLMNTLVYSADYYNLNISKVYRLNEEFLLGINTDRNNLSQYMMRRSMYGKTQKAVIKVIKYSLSEIDRDKYIRVIKELIQFGDITGTDILCGIYYGFRILENEKFRERLK